MAKHKLFVYGTLRPGTTETIYIPGEMYDLGWFPGVKLGGPGCNSHFVAEIIEVDDYKLSNIDSYEGYRENDPSQSLYLRVPYEDGWIYTYNHSFDGCKFIENGDWLDFIGRPSGVRADLVKTRNESVVEEKAAK